MLLDRPLTPEDLRFDPPSFGAVLRHLWRKPRLRSSALRRLTSELAKEGVLMGSTGRFGNVLEIRPPLILSAENADQALETIDRVLGRHAWDCARP